mmetsp:Transcript_16793/g.29427  ORF Transcript_16793/g.29427 Transcript_16793/m.29427 type:complete len:87 (+) Transcript_16793:1542-1802(+)
MSGVKLRSPRPKQVIVIPVRTCDADFGKSMSISRSKNTNDAHLSKQQQMNSQIVNNRTSNKDSERFWSRVPARHILEHEIQTQLND